MSIYGPSGKSEVELDPESIVREFLSLVRFHAADIMRKVPYGSVDKDDLVQAGVVGLLEAAGRFDSTKGVELKSYLTFRIRGSINDHLRERDWLSRGARATDNAIKSAIDSLGEDASEQDIADAMGISLHKYRDKLSSVSAMAIVSFSELGIDGEPEEILESMGSGSSVSPEVKMQITEMIESLSVGIDKLPAQEKLVMVLYYNEEFSMKEISAILGVSEGRVSQIHNQMVIRLRKIMEDKNG